MTTGVQCAPPFQCMTAIPTQTDMFILFFIENTPQLVSQIISEASLETKKEQFDDIRQGGHYDLVQNKRKCPNRVHYYILIISSLAQVKDSLPNIFFSLFSETTASLRPGASFPTSVLRPTSASSPVNTSIASTLMYMMIVKNISSDISSSRLESPP